jgi:hypothetical protein
MVLVRPISAMSRDVGDPGDRRAFVRPPPVTHPIAFQSSQFGVGFSNLPDDQLPRLPMPSNPCHPDRSRATRVVRLSGRIPGMPILPNVASGNSLETLLDSFLPWEPSSGFTSFIPRSKGLRTKHAKRRSVNLRSSAISPLGADGDPGDCVTMPHLARRNN